MGDTIKIAMEDIKKGMAAGGTLSRKMAEKGREYLMRWGRKILFTAQQRFEQCSISGKIVVGLAALGLLITTFLMLFDASDLRIETRETLVVTAAAANMRNLGDLKSPVKTQLYHGTALQILDRKGEWWKVRIEGSQKSGWLHESVVQKRNNRQIVWSYHLRFYEVYFLLAAVALAVGLRLRAAGR